MRKLEITKVKISNSDFRKLSDEHQLFLIYSGYLFDELNWFNRHLRTLNSKGNNRDLKDYANVATYEAIVDADFVQILIVVRHLASKVYESYCFFDENVIDKSWFESLVINFDSKSTVSLKKYLNYIRCSSHDLI